MIRMAILGPSDLPDNAGHNTSTNGPMRILQVDTEPMKKYVLSKLGYPAVEVEISEDQWESTLRTTGDFIAHYFDREMELYWFWTNPLQSAYDMPTRAYWITEVKWDPATTMLNDIFGAESFLFCFGDGLKILDIDNNLIPVEEWNEDRRAKTPFGGCKISTIRHNELQRLIKINYTGGSIVCTPNQPIKINGMVDMLNDWTPAENLQKGAILSSETFKVTSISKMQPGPTTTVYAKNSACFYGCFRGKPILVH